MFFKCSKQSDPAVGYISATQGYLKASDARIISMWAVVQLVEVMFVIFEAKVVLLWAVYTPSRVIKACGRLCCVAARQSGPVVGCLLAKLMNFSHMLDAFETLFRFRDNFDTLERGDRY